MNYQAIQFGNRVIYKGKNAKGNWDLINFFHINQLPGFWFHLDNVSSAHVLIETDKLDKDMIETCARLCKKSDKKEKVIYTTVDNIVKGSQTGQVIINDDTKTKTIKI